VKRGNLNMPVIGVAGAVAQPPHTLVPLGIEAQRHEDHAIAEVNPVDHRHRQGPGIEPGAEPL
jgi:hypothetical protein